MAKISPLQFFRQVKQEVKKVAIASTFFFFVDQILGWIVKTVFSLGV